MTDAEFMAAVVGCAPELSDQQITGLRDLLAPPPVDATIITPRKSARPRADKAA